MLPYIIQYRVVDPTMRSPTQVKPTPPSLRNRSVSPYDRHILRFDRTRFQLSTSPASSDSSSSSYRSELEQTLLKKTTLKEYTLERSVRRTRASPIEVPRCRKKQPVRTFKVNNWSDNYYSSLLDWSHSNFICAAVGNDLCFYNMTLGDEFENSLYRRYCLPVRREDLSAIRFSPTSTCIALGRADGNFQIYDYLREKGIQSRCMHSGRIATIDWKENLIFSGSRDNRLHCIDDRMGKEALTFPKLHSQQICGVKACGNLLASGGNDNWVLLYDLRRSETSYDSYTHGAAVKALTWVGLGSLVSGGGTADKKLKFWKDGQGVTKQIDTGSQVCGLVASMNSPEIVSCQGFSLNQIVIWNLQGKRQLTIHGHQNRVLYCALSPSGEFLATGAGDQQLKVWKLFGRRNEREWELGEIR